MFKSFFSKFISIFLFIIFFIPSIFNSTVNAQSYSYFNLSILPQSALDKNITLKVDIVPTFTGNAKISWSVPYGIDIVSGAENSNTYLVNSKDTVDYITIKPEFPGEYPLTVTFSTLAGGSDILYVRHENLYIGNNLRVLNDVPSIIKYISFILIQIIFLSVTCFILRDSVSAFFVVIKRWFNSD